MHTPAVAALLKDAIFPLFETLKSGFCRIFWTTEIANKVDTDDTMQIRLPKKDIKKQYKLIFG